jgi:hypothetical protein
MACMHGIQDGNGAGPGRRPSSPPRSPKFNLYPGPELQIRVKVSPVPDPVGSPIPVGAPPAPRVTAKAK